ncbi:MAG: hypothetical protein HQK73_07420 [Desulfamplus sp.]|nr:hypothetical protein [Desulfamplus sp.]MBF0412618.1 hypothetical protein [Desulfamplus sp.]
MKHFYRSFLIIAITVLSLTSTARSEVHLNLNMDIDFPDFIMPPTLGFYVAVGVPYDIYRIDNRYFLFHNNRWYKGRYYNGPWVETHYHYLPRPLRRYKHSQIRVIRDREYHYYHKNPHEYRRHKDRYFRPDNRWHEERENRRDNYHPSRRDNYRPSQQYDRVDKQYPPPMPDNRHIYHKRQDRIDDRRMDRVDHKRLDNHKNFEDRREFRDNRP